MDGLEELHLGRNKICDLSGLAGLSSLRTLGVASNRLTSLHGIQTLTGLREVYADHNGIQGMAELAPLVALHTLELSANQLHHVECADLVALEELWLNSNPISDADGIAQLAHLPKLKTVYLEGCPISKTGAYRKIVLGLVPALEQLDADAVGSTAGSISGTRSRDWEGEAAGVGCKRQATG